jgi:DNA-directed RNA polymerase specialized sigma24 family protein
MTCNNISDEKGRIRVLRDMGNRLKAVRNSPQHRAIVLDRLQQLTPRELEICLLHFVEGRSQELIAEWFDLALRVVQRHICRAVLKVPELRPLRTKSLEKVRRPKIYQMSQLNGFDRGPFNVDEI